MAIVKVDHVKTQPINSIKYAVNDKKTMDGLLVEAHNTFTDPNAASTDFFKTRQQFHCRKKNKVYTVMHSFSDKENLTPEEVHKLNLEFARRVFPKEAMWIMGTHTNEEHLHSHFCVNAIMTNGKSFTPDFKWSAKAKEISNQLCVEYGLMHSITVRNGRGNQKHAEYMQGLNSWKQGVRDDIDNLIETGVSYNQLLSLLMQKGYTVDDSGKYIKVVPPGKERYIRLKTLGYWYSEEKLKDRIKYAHLGTIRPNRVTRKELDDYSKMIDLVIKHGISSTEDISNRYNELAEKRNRMDIWLSKAKNMPNMEDKIKEIMDKKKEIIEEMNLYKKMNRKERSLER